MCLPAFGGTGNQSTSLEEEGEAPGGRPRHWERAALELRRVRRGAARIPLRGNPGRISASKVPGRNSQEPGSAVTRAKQAAGKEAVEAAEPVGGSIRQSGGGWSPPLFSNSLQVGGPGQKEGERGNEDCGAQGKRSVKALEPVRNPVRRGGEGRQKLKNKLTP
ncbi:hypothetical protein NDU88_006217 [Pleurodeles waltl]|uniref:Uncharacterized protein n=1 Tax=Pleurodeles waltl TaxID=8319 RepID=A0AAV7WZH4_PLEWA|nr:hypothetical protein NDU88_006217 [Pleurodeles waltl]